MGRLSYGAGDILVRGRGHINSVIISLRADFSWGDILVSHRPHVPRPLCQSIVCQSGRQRTTTAGRMLVVLGC